MHYEFNLVSGPMIVNPYLDRDLFVFCLFSVRANLTDNAAAISIFIALYAQGWMFLNRVVSSFFFAKFRVFLFAKFA
jgi:hypothetical protein